MDDYPRLFVFTVENMRNIHFQQVREDWKSHSKFFMGKNRVMALALGRNESEEYADKVSFFLSLEHSNFKIVSNFTPSPIHMCMPNLKIQRVMKPPLSPPVTHCHLD